MPYCPDCGSEIDPDNVYCSNCGRQLDGGQSGGGGPDDSAGDDWGSDGGDDWGGDDGGDDWGGGGSEDSGEDWAEASSGDGWDDGGDEPYGNPEDQPAGGRGGRGGQPGQGRGGQPRQGRGGGGQPGQGRGGQPRQGRGGGGQPGQGHGGGWEGGQGHGGGWEGGQGQSQRREWGGSQVDDGKDVYIEDGRVNFAIKFPFSDGWGALGISALCYLLSFLILPYFIIEGYLYRVTEAAAWGDTLQPRFDEYGEMLKTGFFYFLLHVVYAIGGFVLVVLPIGLGAEAGLEAVAILLVLVLGSVWLYFGPAILTLYPVTGSFSKALSPSRITDFAFTGKYFGSFLLYIALMFAVQLVFSIAAFVLVITVIGILLYIPLVLLFGPYVLYLTGAYWGATYYEAAQEGLVEPAWDDEQPQNEPYQETDPGGASTWD